MKRFYLLFLVTLFTLPLAAKDKIEKAFDRLALHDYFAARQLFLESLDKKTVPASYGLSKIYMRNNNPFYNLDSARHFILKGIASYALLPADKRSNMLEKYKLDSMALAIQMDSVASRAFAVAQDSDEVDAYNRFLSFYPNSPLVSPARIQRNKLAYADARAKNTSQSYREFLASYPDAAQEKEARRHYDERVFYEQTLQGTPQVYAAFIRSHPDNSYRSQAEDSLYVQLTKSRNASDYYSFAKQYPANRNAPEAWMKLYHRYLDEHGADSFRQFIIDYPDFPYKTRVTDDYRLYNTVLLPVRTGGKWGFVTADGRQAIPSQYDDVDRFSEGLCAAGKNERYGFINKAGRTEIDFQYEEAEAFENSTALVRKDGKALVISRDNEPLMEGMHDDVGSLQENRRVFLDGEQYGYADEKGLVVIPARFETAGDFRNGIAVAGQENKMGIVDRNGNWIVQPRFNFIEMEENGLLRVMLDNKFGLYNRFGEAVLPVEYDAVGKFSGGLALVAKGQKSGYVNDSAVLVLPMTFDFSEETYTESSFLQGYAVVSIRRKAGLIDAQGNRILPPVYEDIRFTSDSVPVAVHKKGKWGYVNLENRTVVEFRYEDAGAFLHGLAPVKLKGRTGVIDTTGKVRLPFEYDDVRLYDDGVVIKKTGFGLMSNHFVLLVPAEYESCAPVAPGIFKLERRKKFGYFNVAKKDWIWKEDGL